MVPYLLVFIYLLLAIIYIQIPSPAQDNERLKTLLLDVESAHCRPYGTLRYETHSMKLLNLFEN